MHIPPDRPTEPEPGRDDIKFKFTEFIGLQAGPGTDSTGGDVFGIEKKKVP